MAIQDKVHASSDYSLLGRDSVSDVTSGRLGRRQNNSTSKTAVATNRHKVKVSTVASSRASRLSPLALGLLWASLR